MRKKGMQMTRDYYDLRGIYFWKTMIKFSIVSLDCRVMDYDAV
jgi:hypothetical protein